MTSDDENNIIPSNKLASETSKDLQKELEKFRTEWRKELFFQDTNSSSSSSGKSIQNKSNVDSQQKTKKKSSVEQGQLKSRKPNANKQEIAAFSNSLDQDDSNDSDLDYEQPKTNEDKAKYLFNKAVLLEQQGRHYDGKNEILNKDEFYIQAKLYIYIYIYLLKYCSNKILSLVNAIRC